MKSLRDRMVSLFANVSDLSDRYNGNKKIDKLTIPSDAIKTLNQAVTVAKGSVVVSFLLFDSVCGTGDYCYNELESMFSNLVIYFPSRT